MWGLLAAVAIVVTIISIVLVQLDARADQARAERRRRYAIPDSDERLPFAEPEPPATPAASPDVAELAAHLTPLFPPEPAAPVAGGLDPVAVEATDVGRDSPVIEGRMVSTPDGEMILTTPPFALRESLLNRRESGYAAAIRARLPDGMVLCPKVRLEALVTPTPPDGRDPEDWRTWRRRVRMRAVDLVICETRDWRPVVAIEVDRPGESPRRLAGGVDRMIDEVLSAVGLPLIRCKGDVESDWGMIEPYLNLLRTP